MSFSLIFSFSFSRFCWERELSINREGGLTPTSLLLLVPALVSRCLVFSGEEEEEDDGKEGGRSWGVGVRLRVLCPFSLLAVLDVTLFSPLL